MEIDIVSLVGQLGFPIAVCLGAMFFIYKIYWANREDSSRREERNHTVLLEFSVTLNKFGDVLKQYGDRLQDIESDVKDIKDRLK